MEEYKILKNPPMGDNRIGDRMTSFRVTFTFSQRGLQKLRYDPPRWIKIDPKSFNYLMDHTVEKLYHQHPYAL